MLFNSASATCLGAILNTKTLKAAARSMPRSSTAGCAAASLTLSTFARDLRTIGDVPGDITSGGARDPMVQARAGEIARELFAKRVEIGQWPTAVAKNDYSENFSFYPY